jgi:hypothetical protein
MKKEISTYKVLIFILVLLNAFLLYRVYNISNEKATLTIKDSKPNNYDSILFHQVYDAAIKSNGLKINTNLELTNSSDETIKISTLIKGSAVLVFDFKYVSCKTCFEDEMTRIVEMSKDFGVNNIILVSEFSSIREQYVLEKKYGINIYNIKNNSFGLPIEKEQFPFIFILDSDYTAKDFYVPTQQFFSMGNIFYKIVFEKYFKH